MNKEIIEKIEKMFNVKVIDSIGNKYITLQIESIRNVKNITTHYWIGEVTYSNDGSFKYECLDAHNYITELFDSKTTRLY